MFSWDDGSLFLLIQAYGWYAGTLVITLVILGKFIFSNYKRWFLKSRQHEYHDENDEDIISQSHPYFTDKYRILKVEIPNLDLMLDDQPVREQLFKDLLTLSFNVVYEVANSIVEDQELLNQSGETWVDSVTHSINGILEKIADKAKNDEIPEIVVQKFLQWQLDSVEQLQEYILLLGNSKLYSTNIAKTNTLLLIINLLLECQLGDIINVVGEINGDISGEEYKGQTIE